MKITIGGQQLVISIVGKFVFQLPFRHRIQRAIVIRNVIQK